MRLNALFFWLNALRRRLNRSPNSSCDASPSEIPLERPDFPLFFLQMCLHDAVLGEALLANSLFEQVPDPAPPHSRANFPFRFQLTELEAPPSRENDALPLINGAKLDTPSRDEGVSLGALHSFIHLFIHMETNRTNADLMHFIQGVCES